VNKQRRIEMARDNAGGGHGSRVVVDKSVRTGTGSRGTRPAGVSQLGYSVGDHTTNRPSSSGYRSEKFHNDRNFQPTKFGNEKALDVGKGGCGTGRTVYGSGSQSQHGDVAGTPRPAGRGFDQRGR
jgi:hypothetical protein